MSRPSSWSGVVATPVDFSADQRRTRTQKRPEPVPAFTTSAVVKHGVVTGWDAAVRQPSLCLGRLVPEMLGQLT